jgi:hypothetical protein
MRSLIVFGVTEAVGMHPVATARLEGTITKMNNNVIANLGTDDRA